MIVQQPDVKGGIAAVTSGYYGSELEEEFEIRYVESYCDGSKVKKLLKAIAGYMDYCKVLSEFKPDLVHIHSSFGASFYRMQPFLNLAVKKGIPVIDHCHGADFEEFYENASQAKKENIAKVFNKYTKVIVLSDEWKERFTKFLPAEKIEVIANYAPIRDLESVKASLDHRYDNRQVVFLGELGKRKGGYDFGRIIKAFREKAGDVRFVFCGDGQQDDKAAILDEIKKNVPNALIDSYMNAGPVLDICSDSKADPSKDEAKRTEIYFTGWVRGAEKDKILDESSVFILPSYQEGLPMSILEAMGFGLPVISTAVGGIPKLGGEDSGCFICEPGDVDSMADAYAGIMSDIDTYKTLSLKNLQKAKAGYGFDAHIGKLTDLYREVMSDH